MENYTPQCSLVSFPSHAHVIVILAVRLLSQTKSHAWFHTSSISKHFQRSGTSISFWTSYKLKTQHLFQADIYSFFQSAWSTSGKSSHQPAKDLTGYTLKLVLQQILLGKTGSHISFIFKDWQFLTVPNIYNTDMTTQWKQHTHEKKTCLQDKKDAIK